jgi:hypothetical protein
MGQIDGGKDSVLTWGDLSVTPIKSVTCNRKRQLNRQKSAEAIVPARRRSSREGLNMKVRVDHDKFERRAETAEYPDRELSSRRNGESVGD